MLTVPSPLVIVRALRRAAILALLPSSPDEVAELLPDPVQHERDHKNDWREQTDTREIQSGSRSLYKTYSSAKVHAVLVSRTLKIEHKHYGSLQELPMDTFSPPHDFHRFPGVLVLGASCAPLGMPRTGEKKSKIVRTPSIGGFQQFVVHL